MNGDPRRTPRTGNALVEFMVIVVIAGVLAAVVLPRYGAHARGVDTGEAHEHITGLIEAAKIVAVDHDPEEDGIGNWPEGDRGEFRISEPTERFTYRICQGAGGNGDAPFAICARGRPGTDVEDQTLTLWVRDLSRGEVETGTLITP